MLCNVNLRYWYVCVELVIEMVSLFSVLPQFQSGVLTKDNATLNDAGDYRCKADNGVGSAAYATIAVDVLCK